MMTKAASPERKTDTRATSIYRVVPIDRIHESKTNPRKTFDPKALQDLVSSIREKNVLVPLLVRQQNGAFEIVAGARRYRAAKQAGLAELPVIVRELTDEQALETQVIENLQREDVHPMEEAEGYARLLKAGKYDVEAIAAKVGKSASYIYQRLKFSDLIEPAKKIFLDGTIHAGHAVLLARLSPSDQKDAIDALSPDSRQGREYTITARNLAAWIHEEVYLNLDSAPWKKDDATLLPKAGPCTTCPKRAGNAPNLFPELKQGNTCTDRACFHKKFDAWVGSQRDELEKSGAKGALIATDWFNSSLDKGLKDVLQEHSYRKIARGAAACDTTRKGIVVHGKDRGAVLDVCIDTGCRKEGHYEKGSYSSGSSSSPRTAVDEKKRQAELLKERITARQRELIYRETIKKTEKLTRQDLELLGARLGTLPYVPSVKDLFSKVGEYGDEAKTSDMSDRELAQYLVASALGRDTGIHQPAKDLYATAARLKIDVKAIEALAGLEMKNLAAHKEQVRKWNGRVASKATRYEVPTCATCGCVAERACPGGCSWSKLDKKTNRGICTACKE